MPGPLHLTEPTLIYAYDPMCSWCWGYRETFAKLLEALPDAVNVYYLLGGLASDTSEPMPAEQQQRIQATWKQIEQNIPGVKFNYDFWQLCAPRRSTYPACRAVIAATLCGKEKAMIDAIQRAYYLQARNPSDNDVLEQLATEIGIEHDTFCQHFYSNQVRQLLDEQLQFARSISAQSFPSLFLYLNQQAHPIELDYNHAELTLEHINSYL